MRTLINIDVKNWLPEEGDIRLLLLEVITFIFLIEYAYLFFMVKIKCAVF